MILDEVLSNTLVAGSRARLGDYTRLEKTVFARGNTERLTVAVVGAGALGNEVVKALGLIGAQSVLIVDPDKVEPSNLTRSIFFRQEFCPDGFPSRNKAEALAEAAGALFPETRFRGVAAEIADTGLALLAGQQLLFSCVDSDLARVEIARISTKLGIPVCDGGLGAPDYSCGRVTWFPGRTGACFACLLTPRKLRRLLTLWDATVRPCEMRHPGEPYPSTPTMAAITGALQVELGLRHLLGGVGKQGESRTAVITLDAGPRLETFRTPVSSACPFHDLPAEDLVPAPGPDATLGDFLSGYGPGSYLALDWPICTGAQCRACGHGWAPMRRSAVFRTQGACPACRSRDILERETTRAVDAQSKWAVRTLGSFGLPEHHLLTVRRAKAQS
jgi:molybdopterin-synthase adenylyltransferase